MIKRLFPILFLLVSGLRLAAQADEKVLVSTIKDVTVFLQGAQVTRTAQLITNPGVNKLVFKGISHTVDRRSLQVAPNANVTILSVAYQENFLRSKEKPASVKQMEDSLEKYEMLLAKQADLRAVLDEQQSLLLTNKSIGGANVGVKLDELEVIAEYFKTQLTQIKKELFEVRNNEKRYREMVQKYRSQLAENVSKMNQPSHEVVVTLNASGYLPLTLELSYFVTGAGWLPKYDIRAIDTKKPIQLVYKADISQQTGEEWGNIKMTLSTSNPTVSGTMPQLGPQFLSLVDVQAIQKRYEEAGYANTYKYKVEKDASTEKGKPAGLPVINENQLSVEFVVGQLATVPSDGKPHQVDVEIFNLTASFRHFAVPKLDRDAFLMARITGWESLNLLPGTANIYFGGTYVGESFINTLTLRDTLDISLGRDKKVVINRVKIKEMNSRSFFGSKRRELVYWEISAKNNRNEPVDLLLEDQIPVSTNKSISVDLKDKGEAEFHEGTGKLTWKINLEPTAIKKVKFGFEVEYPKDDTIRLQGL